MLIYFIYLVCNTLDVRPIVEHGKRNGASCLAIGDEKMCLEFSFTSFGIGTYISGLCIVRAFGFKATALDWLF